ncbi:MAG: DoxX family membrane protein [Desulfobacterales bacterium]|nr:DoxX family membrane protein [Desulfobacterales bacterium]
MSNLRQSIISNSWIELAARWILGFTFIYASFHKIISPADFAKIVYGYGLFPAGLINLIAIIIPFLELVGGLALLLGYYPRSAAVIINGLLLAFIVVLSINLVRGHEFDCGCFSAGQSGYASSPKVTLLRDIIYFILGLQVILFGGIRRMSIKSLRR